MRGPRHCLARLRSDQRGATAIEFGLIAPVFFALLLSVIDIGRYMWTLNTMQYAVDGAIRAGVIRELSDQEIEDLVVDALGPARAGAVVAVDSSAPDSIEVTATSTYNFFFPISSFVNGVAIDLRSEMPR